MFKKGDLVRFVKPSSVTRFLDQQVAEVIGHANGDLLVKWLSPTEKSAPYRMMGASRFVRHTDTSIKDTADYYAAITE